jgi:sigma-B regulation protein RsbU (phosphoserine phosphatase)
VTEGKNPDGELFSNKRLQTLLERPATSARDLLERVRSELFGYISDAPQFDDITLLAVRRQSRSIS